MKEAERAAAAGFLEAVSLAAAEEAAGPWEAVSLAVSEARVSSFGNRSSHPDRPDPSRSIPTHRRGLLPMSDHDHDHDHPPDRMGHWSRISKALPTLTFCGKWVLYRRTLLPASG